MPTQSKPPKAHRAVPFNLIHDRARPLYVPHRSRHVRSSEWRHFEGPILPEWGQFAEQKGFRVHARVRDSRHLELECLRCGSLTAHKLYTLRTARPRCGGCTGERHQSLVEQAQLEFLYRDTQAHRYAYYRAKCGHRLRRQFELIHRVALGLTDVRCEICLQSREEAEAKKQGWTRLGRDPKGNPNYRLYQHSCGRHQRAARANMTWGQVSCSGCGKTWSSKPSYVYLFSIEVGDDTPRLLKLGYSKHPEKRLRHQLGLPRSAKVEILRVISMPTGHDACESEQAAHASLLRQMPAAVPAQTVYSHALNVSSEVYFPFAEPMIQDLMDAIEAEASGNTLIT